MRILVLLLIAALLATPLFLFHSHRQSEVASADTGQYLVYGYYDGYVWKTATAGNYTTAHDAVSGDDVTTVSKNVRVGQDFDGSYYYIYRGILLFDTQSLPYNANITDVNIYLFGRTAPATNFNITFVEIQFADVSTPITVSDYETLGFSTNSLGSYDTVSGWSTTDYNVISLNAVGIEVMQRGGITVFGVRSDEDISSSAPAGSEWLDFWSSEVGPQSGSLFGRPVMEITYTIPSLGTPNPFRIDNVQVFSGYQEDSSGNQLDDRLFVIEYECSYGSFNIDKSLSENPRYYFNIRIKDSATGTVLAQTELPRFGHAVASIYLAPNNTYLVPDPVYGEYYNVDIAGNPNQFNPNIYSVDYVLWQTGVTSSYPGGAWKGSDLTRLDSLVRSTAAGLQGYYEASLLVTVGGKSRLNSLGAEVFDAGIPELSRVRPALYQVSKIYPYITNYPHSANYTGGPSGAFGVNITAAFNGVGSYLGVSGQFLAAGFWMFIMLIVAGVAVIASGNTNVAIIVSIPILFIGNYLSVIPIAVTALLVVGMTFLVLHNMFLQRT